MNWRKQVDDFKGGLKIDAPVISTSAIRFGFFGLSGGGKSVTAGVFSLGITPSGLIGWVDGEGQRAPWAIDTVCEMAVKHYGGTKEDWKARFRIIHIDPPFNPLRVVAAAEALEEAGCKTIVLDILSQCWRGDGSYLDLKADEVDRMIEANPRNTEQRVASSAAAHIKPWTHDKLVNKVTNSKSNLVLLFQAKQKFNAKISKPDEFITPIQESGLTTTAIAVGRVECNERGEGGYCSFQLPTGQGAKHTHPSILAALPKNGEQFKFQHAEAILRLCGGKPLSKGAASTVQSGSNNAATTHPAAASSGLDSNALKSRLWKITKQIHQGDKQGLVQWLWDEAILETTEQLESLSLERLEQVLLRAEAKMKT